MKKFYFAPEIEEVKIQSVSLLSSSPDPDTTDPVEVIDNPSDDDLNWP